MKFFMRFKKECKEMKNEPTRRALIHGLENTAPSNHFVKIKINCAFLVMG